MNRLLLCALLLMATACADNSSTPPTQVPVPMVCCSGTLIWEQNTESDLAGYRVYRSESPTISNPPTSAPIATPTTNEFVDTTGIEGTTYYYVVTAVDLSANESGISNEVSRQY